MQESYKNQGRSVQSLDIGRFARKSFYTSISTFVVFLLSFVLAPYLTLEANAETVSGNINWAATYLVLDPDKEATDAGESIDLATHGDISFGEISPTSKNPESGNVGTMMIKKKTIEVDTNGKFFSVYLSTSDSDNSLVYTDGETKLSSIKIPATSGSWETPSAFSGAAWGFSVPETPVTVSDSSELTPDFAGKSVYTPAVLNVQLTSANGGSAYTSNYAAVPGLENAQEIWRAETTNLNGFSKDGGDTKNNHFDVYYAVVANENTLAGTYENEVVYTAIASSASLDSVSTNLAISTPIGGESEPETVYFDLASSPASISESDITIALVPHKTMLESAYMRSDFSLSRSRLLRQSLRRLRDYRRLA